MACHSIDELKSAISYDQESGIFTWLKTPGQRTKAGNEAGCLRNGYRALTYKGERYQCHRLAWLFIYGHFPVNFIDHIDGDRSNNRIKNLRDVTLAENNKNRHRVNATSKIGLLGVGTGGRGYVGRITRDGVTRHLGVFDTPEEAHSAYMLARSQL